MINSKSEKIFQLGINLILIMMSLIAILPIWLLISGSITEESELINSGFKLIPHTFSSSAYEYLVVKGKDILHAFSISIFITVFGTVLSLLTAPMLAYAIFRKDFFARNAVAFFVFFTMLFNGGIVPAYIMWTQYFHIRNTVWALIFPGLLMNGFNIILIKNYFGSNIPDELLESARIDGASELKIYFKVILPLSLPILATVGLLVGINYWNDWTNGLYYVTKSEFFSLQNLLNRILQDVQYLASSTNISGGAKAGIKMPTSAVRMAISVVGVAPIMLLYPFFQKYFVKGITVGAVKG